MGIYDFNILTDHDKYDTVFTKGKFVDTVLSGNVKYVLYSLSYFWVEVQYNSFENKIIGISSFVAGKSLDRYSNLPKMF
ncbi:hypothetical protein SAMN04488007_3470 [Maribacter aquivivus]|uniref:Uncharacterized protein n=1 Tax=Maribacter aquivivus TaxID=228958 RepID=A0A1M6U3M1_9FLAO|nr:hypothetical protein [Maribacter aquivivus]SHK63741.1 hypothetical protein SAMN04488007_3470 [Maribacter aquivivus]